MLFIVLLGLSHAEEMDSILEVEMAEHHDREDYITEDIHGLPINEFRFKSATELVSSKNVILWWRNKLVLTLFFSFHLSHAPGHVHGLCNFLHLRTEQFLPALWNHSKSQCDDVALAGRRYGRSSVNDGFDVPVQSRLQYYRNDWWSAELLDIMWRNPGF